MAGDRVTEVGDLRARPGERVIDAGGLALAPGFIDTHSHHSGGLFDMRDAVAAVSQGITTIVVGQDGGSRVPLSEFLARLEREPPAVNVASYSGHGSIREQVMGEDFKRAATEQEIERMRALLRADMQAGALGLSTGLEYDPGIYSAPQEVVELAKVASAFGGRYISHIRSEDRQFWQAIDEIIAIGREARIPVQVSHIKLAMRSLWGRADSLVRVLDRARASGVDITADIYPYTYWQSTLTVLFPERDFENRTTAEFVLREISTPDGLLLASFDPDTTYVGRTVAQIAAARGTDPPATLMALIREALAREKATGNSAESVIGTSMNERDIERLLVAVHERVQRRRSGWTPSARVRRVHARAGRVHARAPHSVAGGGDPKDDEPLRSQRRDCRARAHRARLLRRPGPVRPCDRARQGDARGAAGAVGGDSQRVGQRRSRLRGQRADRPPSRSRAAEGIEMKRGLIVLLGLLCAPTLAAQLPDSIARRVDSVFMAFDKPTSPGCALGVYNAGEIAYTRGYGSANLEHGIPITPRTVFDLGSTSKQFTAMSVTLLEQDGKLSLDDDVRRWIPELPAYPKPVTIRQLVHHTSGLRDYLTLMWLRGINFDGVTTSSDALSLIVRQRGTNFEPGSEYLYSNSGYFLLSEIVRRASGKTLAVFASERIFAPLGMQVTHFHDDHTMIVPHRATGYTPRDSGTFRIAMSGFEQVGDGSVMTTVEELARWDRNFYAPRVGGRALLEAMHVPARLTTGRTLEYASGLMVGQYRGLRTVRHGGSWAGYRAELLRFPEQRTSVAVLCNYSRSGPGRLAQRVADILLREQLTAAATASATSGQAAPSGGAIARYVGTFRDAATDELRTISARGDTLFIDYGDGELSVLRPLGEGRFAVEGSTWEVHFSSPAALIEQAPNQPPATFVRFARAKPTARDMDAYAGAYYSDELDVRWTIATDSGRLVARIPGGDTLRLTPTVRDTFVGGGVVMKFRRSGGRVTGALLHSGRVRNIVFTRVRAP